MNISRYFSRIRAVALASVIFSGGSALAIDPPHLTTSVCGSCHFPHVAAGADLTTVAGNANLCMSCHSPGGSASVTAFVAADQALPWPGLVSGTSPAGSSHRWDASAAGHLQFLGGATTPSTGTLIPVGVYTNVYAKTYTIQIAAAGVVGSATFNWSATTPGGGSGAGVLTGTNSPLDSGVALQFIDGTNISFQTGDRWYLFVRSDLRNPTNSDVVAHTINGVVTCSACHNEHSELLQPFDPLAQPYLTNSTGLISGTNRHFMRVANNFNQLCNDCHAVRNVTNAAAGSHPVELTFSADAKHKMPVILPLELATTNMGCLTCHIIHHGLDADGKTLRLTSSVALCDDCHTLSDITSSHFSTTNSATLWPGGKFGSLMPARTDPNDRGTCLNCHATHGWPTNSVNLTIHYEHLLADYQENFCYTCHGTNGPAAKLVYADFQRAYRHPVANSDSLRHTGRSVECDDCHNPHKAKAGSHVYTATATATRNNVTNAPSLIGVSGVAVDYSSLTNFQAPAF
jgi:predicted CXXCH cytochrome family protein